MLAYSDRMPGSNTFLAFNNITKTAALTNLVLFKQIEGLFIFILLPLPLWRFAGSFLFFSGPDVLPASVWLLCSFDGELQLGH